MRVDGRKPDEMRPVKITTRYLKTAEGSALIEVGNTRVLCAASIERPCPQWLRGGGQGLGDSRVFDAAPRHHHSQRRAKSPKDASRAARSRSSG